MTFSHPIMSNKAAIQTMEELLDPNNEKALERLAHHIKPLEEEVQASMKEEELRQFEENRLQLIEM